MLVVENVVVNVSMTKKDLAALSELVAKVVNVKILLTVADLVKVLFTAAGETPQQRHAVAYCEYQENYS